MTLHHRTAARYGYAPLLFFAALSALAGTPDSQARLSPDLAALYRAAMTGPPGATATTNDPSAEHFDAQGRVLVEVDLACAGALPTAALRSAGLSVSASVNVPPLCAVEGWVAPKSLATLAQVSGVVRIKLPASAAAAHSAPLRRASAQL
jgi:hypothetical protein